MKVLSGCLLVLAGAVVALGIGSVLPRLVFADEGLSAYSGQKKAFTEFALIYDSELREWSFPVDPTVARRVTEVSGTPDASSVCKSEGTPEGSPYDTGYFAGDYRAEVVHYGPFFIPTGKNVFDCDVAYHYNFFLPQDTEEPLFSLLGVVVLLGGFGLAMGTVFVPAFLTVGGGFLLLKSPQRSQRVVGLGALVLGLALGVAVLLAVATAVF